MKGGQSTLPRTRCWLWEMLSPGWVLGFCDMSTTVAEANAGQMKQAEHTFQAGLA